MLLVARFLPLVVLYLLRITKGAINIPYEFQAISYMGLVLIEFLHSCLKIYLYCNAY
jgi:hypothetical protein